MTKENAQPQITASSKTCNACGETKSAEEFHKDKSRKDGLNNRCKPCACEQRRTRYYADPEKDREYSRKYRADNPEKKRESSRKWYVDNQEHAIEYAREWRAANPEKGREYRRRYRADNPDKIHAYNQEALAKRSRRVARIRKMMAHFDGRTGWLENLAAAIAMRSDAQGLCWIAADIDELLLIHFYKEV